MKQMILLFFLILSLSLFSNEKTPLSIDPNHHYYNRALLTISCTDCNNIPKVPNAGQIISENDLEYQIMHNGLKIVKDCYYGNWMTEIIFHLKGHHEPQEEKVFYEILKTLPSDATMIELGSFWSYYSMWFQHYLPHATNYLIEPNPKRLAFGMQNFTANNLRGHFFHGKAGAGLYNKAKPIHNIADLINLNKKDAPLVQMDEFIADHNIPYIHILHSDIQGVEYQMLESCSESLKRGKIGFFFISTHGDEKHQKCLNFFKEMGCHIIAEHTHTQSYSGDGLIVASSKYYPHLSSIKISKVNGKQENE